MPPFGLYPIPRHHLYGGEVKRPMYNTKDFEDDVVAKPTKTEAVATAENEKSEGKREKKRGRGRVYRKGRKKKKERRNKEHTQDSVITKGLGIKAEDAGVAATANQTLDTKSISGTKLKCGRSRKDGMNISDQESSKKRKWQSEEGPLVTPPSVHASATNFVVGNDMLKALKSSMSGLGTQFMQGAQPPSGEASKKQRKSGRKIEGTPVVLVASNDKMSDQCQSMTGKKPYLKIDEHPKISTLSPTTEHKQKQNIKSKDNLKGTKESTKPLARVSVMADANTTTLKKTPVPLPPKQFMCGPRRLHGGKEVLQTGAKHLSIPISQEVLIPETPPTSYVGKARNRLGPLTSSQLAEMPETPSKRSKKQRQTENWSFSSGAEGHNSQPSAQVKVKAQHDSRGIGGQASLTSANLNRFTQPLRDEPKPNPLPRLRRASSIGSLPSSSASSMSIFEAFKRVGMPYSRRGIGQDAFTTPEENRKEHRETHEEAQMNAFDEMFQAVQKAVNFTEEQLYLDWYLDWQAENDTVEPLPCLGQASGCTPKKEEILRLGKEEDINIRKVLDNGGLNQDLLNGAHQSAQKAEEFLMLAVRARVPVPIGKIEGTYTLYCPQYAASHFDRYGYGKRTFTIASIAGFKDKNLWTARLSIPPRPMSYTILTFSAPPHASFRTTTIKTSAEEYEMEVIFLGNGYMQLRVDLNLLLRGKPTENFDGKKLWMEFLGVHQKALKWVEERGDIER
ncbi:hypothetical protein CC78DRAFT_592851 [Lojkania enalia]|uniref:Uncharacterized protein n=1 Tax=Lojkania enalia TaxID=147567 RepID=A0A9P4JYF1_9PLEO|nr:hypothetical protein CC78DRAFT_592851 [Didymosphaeria enalia]